MSFMNQFLEQVFSVDPQSKKAKRQVPMEEPRNLPYLVDGNEDAREEGVPGP